MSQAKSMKLREYGTDILSHDTQSANTERCVTRNNNTFKSSIMDADFSSTQTLSTARSRERIFQDNPLSAKVKRASYQDSNIFGYKGNEDPTVQGSAADSKAIRSRYNPTYNSQVFREEVGQEDDGERARSKNRHDDRWQSTVFDGPVPEKSKRKKLGQADAKVDELFGKEKCDFENKSNAMAVIGQPKQSKWKPVRQQKTAEQRKNDELYGRSAAVYGTGKKGDGTLMANGADWKNLQQTHTNLPSKQNGINNQESNKNCKDKKFQNLQSNILSNEDKEDQALYNTDKTDKAAFGTNSNWTAQGGSAKVVNRSSKVDTYKKKQQQLQSQVFETTDYSEHIPMKKKTLDINNLNDKKRQGDHLYSDIFGNASSMRSPGGKKGENLLLSSNDWQTTDVKGQIKKDYTNYSTKGQKASQQKSSLDTHNYEADQFRQAAEEPEQSQLTLPGKHSRATKVRDLSSDIMGTGNSLQKFNENLGSTVVDLDIRGLPENIKEEDLKKLSGVKHVIATTIDQDSIRNVCTGTGRIKMRIAANEDLDSIKLQYIKAGYAIQEHTNNPQKKTGFTEDQALRNKSPAKNDIDAKTTKQSNLQSNNPEVFGNNSSRQTKFQNNFDSEEANQGKQAALTESLALQSWGKVGPRK